VGKYSETGRGQARPERGDIFIQARHCGVYLRSNPAEQPGAALQNGLFTQQGMIEATEPQAHDQQYR
jgi:hypothetical protein